MFRCFSGILYPKITFRSISTVISMCYVIQVKVNRTALFGHIPLLSPRMIAGVLQKRKNRSEKNAKILSLIKLSSFCFVYFSHFVNTLRASTFTFFLDLSILPFNFTFLPSILVGSRKLYGLRSIKTSPVSSPSLNQQPSFLTLGRYFPLKCIYFAIGILIFKNITNWL